MLSSIHPLGERTRHNSYAITVLWHVAGGVTTGAALGAVLGGAGEFLFGQTNSSARIGASALVILAAALADQFGRTPTRNRQVDERWLQHYRRWVYAGGYGAQLGPGVLTIVTTNATWATWLLAFTSGSWTTGLSIGITSGALRTAVVLVGRRIKTPDDLRRFHERFVDTGHVIERVAPPSLGLLGLAALGMAVF